MQNDFRLLRLGLPSRLALAGGCFALGVALELAIRATVLPGLAVVLAGWVPLLLKPATNKPEDRGLEEWRPVTMAELDRLDDSLRQSKKLRRKTRDVRTAILLAFVWPFFAIAVAVCSVLGRGDIAFAAWNAAAFFVPALFFGRVRVFLPRDIDLKMPGFRALLEEKLPEGAAAVPYFRFDKDAAGRDVPEDLRIMYELKRPPSDFVGIQVQAAVNKGPNGNVPYLYAVVLAKGEGGAAHRLARDLKPGGFEIEPGGAGGFSTVVIRQSTGGGGYETTELDCRRLARTCVGLLGAIAESAPAAS